MLTGDGFRGGLADTRALWFPAEKQEYLRFVKRYKVIHLHDIIHLNDLDPTTVTLILSLRRDTFAQAMSFIVARTVGEWTGPKYSNKMITPVTFDKTEFVDLLKQQLSWQDALDLSGYKKVVTIYYEDLVDQGAEFVANKLDLNYNKLQVGHVYQPSPYRYKDIILNWEELQQEYLKIINGVVL
jgi:LPS sulfotransferase NodH